MERVYLGFFLYFCVFVYCRSFLSFLVYVFTVNTALFAALDAK